MAKPVINPEAELPLRPQDSQLTESQLGELGVFAALKKTPAFAKFPGTCVLRHYRAGDVICRQGEAGGTAFYLLTRSDTAALLKHCAETLPDGAPPIDKNLQNLLQTATTSASGLPADDATPHRLATARLMVDMRRGPTVRSQGAAQRGQSNGDSRPSIIANDGPADFDYETRQAAIYEGEVFGEMSCLTRQPRSATVVVDSECFVLEFLRNILEQMRKDAKYNEEAQKKYRERVLEGHLRQLSIFRLLSADEFNRVRERVELVQFAPGTLIWDEGDPSDAVCVVRSGIVQVLQSFPWRLTKEAITNWPKMWEAMRAAADANPMIERLRKSLPKAVQDILAADSEPGADAQSTLIDALNEVAKTTVLLAAKEMQPAMADLRVSRETKAFGPKVNTWTGLQTRTAHRLLFHVLIPDAVAAAPPLGLSRVIQYLSRGGVLGEIGVVRKKPRTAACVAYAHPQIDREATDVELVRVPAEVIYEIEESNPLVRAEIEKLIRGREEQDKKAAQTPIASLSASRRVEQLGLLQGQKLMLIDLDRCTRCGDCVQACIDTHNDGHSRLYLDGPRFGKYLVPSACRQCRDPVCMIGCPVGSIQQGADGEIQIREWCIGCCLCVKQCPYDSIHLHDVAVLPSGAPGWRWTIDSALSANDKWAQPAFGDTAWRAAQTPFFWGLEMHLAMQSDSIIANKNGSDSRLFFRVPFRIDRSRGTTADKYQLLITSQGASLAAYVNGRSINLTQDAPQKKRNQYACDLEGDAIHDGENVLAISVAPPNEFGATVLDARLDTLAPVWEKVEEKLVTERAVVCDQCSSLSGNRAACVYACPHEAAMRVDAWEELPNY
ncbi:MAG TPA: hypothetical protein VHU84_09495 [Lacipirellulaceae bacterium]|jgi:Fe-S-cluster-containing dehydrogenase component|nr:hypothetical protein [Lacipirellulaceae bacterium]